MTVTLHADRVTKRFDAQAPVLRDIELTAAAGTVTHVCGHGASGKSTLLRCLAGVYRIDAGSVRVSAEGEELTLQDADARTVAWLRRTVVDVVDGRLVAAPRESARAAGARVLEHAGVDDEEAGRRAGELLQGLGLAQVADTPVGLLPAHARRAIAMGRRLLCPTGVLLLDEPTHGLSEQATEHLLALVANVRRRGVAVLATGGPGDPLRHIADQTLDLQDGAIS